mmetsp:Transcript_25161/g.75771  ORF Transcript_25161/g.75771 Transcript_25161/m.75771 type:complete len:86 (+) Transcript_25161:668-925(+)
MESVERFADPLDGVGDEPQWAVLITSGTNVAVDRILTSLLEQGFTDFVRVGLSLDIYELQFVALTASSANALDPCRSVRPKKLLL